MIESTDCQTTLETDRIISQHHNKEILAHMSGQKIVNRFHFCCETYGKNVTATED